MSDSETYLIDLSAHGRIRATGEDRARLVHALCTNHIQQLQRGQGAYAFFLTAQGRIIADAHILCFSDSLLLDLEPETRELMLKHLDHYIIADDVTVDDETKQTFCFGVEGAAAQQFLGRLEAPIPGARESHVAWENLTVAAISATGAGGYRIYGPVGRKGELWEQFLLSGAKEGNLHALRVEHFQPRYGEDITEKTLAQETALPHALHFQKGCYLGQEIVERIRSRTHVNRMLSGLHFEADPAPDPGTPVLKGDATIGKITSAEGQNAIAMLRVEHLKPGTELLAAGRRAITQPIAAG
ncbi:MAG: hypothetical protein M3Z36_11640 [Acidobacteriota bacterium]|nr:hypothetical protein [Acidobacteriota bacterium]